MSYWKHTIEGVDFSEYKLWERELIFGQICNDNNVELEQPPYAIVWEDPDDIDAPVKITVPAPKWWAMALHGGILPPVQAYWALKEDEDKEDFVRHTRGWLLHDTKPMDAMTEEQAMEYLVMKDIPPRVWRDYKGNRKIMKIVPRNLIPTDREHRNAWKIRQEQEAA